MKDPRDIIKRPIITEKSTELMENNKYVFEVDYRSNKIEIRNAVEKIFGVKVEEVRTMNLPGKAKRYGKYTGFSHYRKWKKAIVKLTADSKGIEIFEGQ